MFHRLLLSDQKPWKVLLIISFIVFIFRLPTLFNDYYNTDEIILAIQGTEILEGGIPYKDYVNHKLPLMDYIYAFIFFFFGSNNLYAIHMITIFIVVFTSFYLYKIILFLTKDYSKSYFAALSYGIFITAFEESFMASNLEVIFNLPVSMACYFFVKRHFGQSKRYILVITISFLLTISLLVKHQAVLLLGAIIFYLLLVEPLLKKGLSYKANFVLAFNIGLWFLVFLVISHLFMYFAGYLEGALFWGWQFNFSYIEASGASFKTIFFKFIERQGLLFFVQLVLWIGFITFVKRFIFSLSSKNADREKAYFLFLFFIFSYIPIFLGGVRFYYHYFMQYLPSLALIGGFHFSWWKTAFQKRGYVILFNGLIIFIIIGFSIWHYHDIYKKYYVKNPLTPRSMNYLVERPEYKDVTKWIRDNSTSYDKIFVWGECPQFYYFSNRRLGGRFFIFNLITLENSGIGKNFDEADQYSITFSSERMSHFLDILVKDFKQKKPRYIIDTSFSDYEGYKRYPIKNYFQVYNYINDNYKQRITISKMVIWERIS